MIANDEDEDWVKSGWDFPHTEARHARGFLSTIGQDGVRKMLNGSLIVGKAMPAPLRAELEKLMAINKELHSDHHGVARKSQPSSTDVLAPEPLKRKKKKMTAKERKKKLQMMVGTDLAKSVIAKHGRDADGDGTVHDNKPGKHPALPGSRRKPNVKLPKAKKKKAKPSSAATAKRRQTLEARRVELQAKPDTISNQVAIKVIDNKLKSLGSKPSAPKSVVGPRRTRKSPADRGKKVKGKPSAPKSVVSPRRTRKPADQRDNPHNLSPAQVSVLGALKNPNVDHFRNEDGSPLSGKDKKAVQEIERKRLIGFESDPKTRTKGPGDVLAAFEANQKDVKEAVGLQRRSNGPRKNVTRPGDKREISPSGGKKNLGANAGVKSKADRKAAKGKSPSAKELASITSGIQSEFKTYNKNNPSEQIPIKLRNAQRRKLDGLTMRRLNTLISAEEKKNRNSDFVNFLTDYHDFRTGTKRSTYTIA